MQDENEYSEDYEPQAPGMATGTKVLLISLSVLGVLVVACCGGVIYTVNKYFDWEISDDPVVVKKTQREILDLQVPARFDPKQSLKMKIVFADMDMAMFEASGADMSQLAVMKMVFTMEDVAPEQAEAQFNQQNPNPNQLDDVESETRTYTVDGKEISVTFSHGTLRASEDAPAGQVGEEWYSVSSMMSAPRGMVMFSVTGPEEEYDEEEIENMIESIQFPAEE